MFFLLVLTLATPVGRDDFRSALWSAAKRWPPRNWIRNWRASKLIDERIWRDFMRKDPFADLVSTPAEAKVLHQMVDRVISGGVG